VGRHAGTVRQDLDVPDESAFSFADFDRYVEEHGIPDDDYPAAFALWYAKTTGEPVLRFEEVEREPADLVVEGDDVLSPAFSHQLRD
jgi:hypothetical protein